VIEPTIGRQVWFYPNGDTRFTQYAGHGANGRQPLAATVIYVWSNTRVNLSVIDHAGAQHAVGSVKLLQDEELSLSMDPYATWMPYQKGQAAKTEASQHEVDALQREARAREIERAE
jgi:hypothetical protein